MAMLSATTFRMLSAVCTACRSTPGCGSGGWNGRQSCCGLLLSVLGVAQSVGYGSASQFTAAFRRQYGMTPAKYRKDV
ncbi:MAG: helix-turn-helix domain-containing protein [Dysosmobacter welbionis]